MLCKIWGFHGGDYEECRLQGYKNTVRILQESHYVSAIEPSRLMLCKTRGVYGVSWDVTLDGSRSSHRSHTASQPRRRHSSLGLWVRISLQAWMYVCAYCPVRRWQGGIEVERHAFWTWAMKGEISFILWLLYPGIRAYSIHWIGGWWTPVRVLWTRGKIRLVPRSRTPIPQISSPASCHYEWAMLNFHRVHAETACVIEREISILPRARLPFLYLCNQPFHTALLSCNQILRPLNFPDRNCFFSSENCQLTSVRKLCYEIIFTEFPRLLVEKLPTKVRMNVVNTRRKRQRLILRQRLNL
jgi:hypothetical protein